MFTLRTYYDAIMNDAITHELKCKNLDSYIWSIRHNLLSETKKDLEVNISPSIVNPVIFDTGASLAITMDKNDFIESLKNLRQPTTLSGMANGVKIAGIGKV